MRNPVLITGDWHSTFVNDIKADFSDPDSATVATEFVGTSISSNGDGPVYGPYYGPMIHANPHIKFFDGDRRGYVRCRVDREHWRDGPAHGHHGEPKRRARVHLRLIRGRGRQTRSPTGLSQTPSPRANTIVSPIRNVVRP